MGDKVTGQCPQTTTFERERRAEAESSQGPATYQPNTLLLVQAGSQHFKPENSLDLDKLWSVAGAMFVGEYGQVRLKSRWF